MAVTAILADILSRAPGAPAAAFEAATRWWEAERADGQDLVAFLIARHVLTEAAPIVLEMAAEGTIPKTAPERVLTPAGIERLREAASRADTDPNVHLGGLTDHIEPASPPTAPAPPAWAAASPTRSPTGSPVRSPWPDSGGAVSIHPEDDADALPPVGSTLGRCLLLERVGDGAAGVVFRAIHTTLNIPVAVKVFRRSALRRADGTMAEFRTEARLLAQLNHPNVVRVWDFEDDPRYPYLVMEFVEGLTLAELIATSGRLQPDRAAAVVAQVAAGLRAAASLGIIHRDVKPANVLITRSGDAKLADLGLAVVVGGRLKEAGGTGGGLAGTAAYMAPEQATGDRSLDHRADIYSLGATFYHAVTGHLPFPAKQIAVVLMKHATEMPRPPHELAPGLDERVSEVVLTMLAKKPAERYQTYDELLTALAELRDRMRHDGPVPVPGPPPGPRPPVESPRSVTPTRSVWQTIRSTFGGKRPDEQA